ncbi:hypothetical protein K470DRAFT_281296 [Piedraia hortae CBS 480.64]|uniref:ATPase synthesis protein 25 n=1 Tax=Piedraia hortae CBS 480.64 TaxID=1314780 RepID=A0A6A7C3V0_9PEZI|nr:hypothetical protein K470DRAFT_281296 [Piedraia hortae CBS 480.64]
MPEFSLRPRRQELPSLPPHPPPILSPLLEQLSAQYGIDDISLLDLRTLDPPSALGDNLIMLIGTARSEKHVHAVADRLCRWLRSEPYKLSPSADGLIGQNELKIRLKRRAKRMRIRAMSAAATPEAELDDGTTTSWVCVNLGEVDGGVLPKQREQRMFVGFGSSHAGSNLVVQIFTVEKRAQVDLEKLWMGILERAREGGEADENGEGF